MLNNGGERVKRGLNWLEIREFLCNRSALYREAFFYLSLKGLLLLPLFELRNGLFCF